MQNVFTKIDENLLKKIITESKSISEVFNKMGLCPSGSQYKIFKKITKELNIDLNHFKGDYSKETFFCEIPTEKMFKENTAHASNTIKRKILKNNLICYKCSECGNDGNWKDKKLSLQIDHINGIRTDNRLENLRFLCPNCHSQTETYAGKQHKRHKYCEKCGKRIHLKSKICHDCHSENISQKTKIIWPSKEELQKLVWEKPMTQIATELGVSDSAIIKRCKKLEILKPKRGYWIKNK